MVTAADRRWLKATYPDDPEMQGSHETIYRTLSIQSRGALRKELTAHLRTGRAIRRPAGTRLPDGRGDRPGILNISERPAETEDRAVPGHWEGDLVFGKRMSPVATLVERSTRFGMLVALPNGHKADLVAEALAAKITTPPAALTRTLTWDQGHEMATHARFTQETGIEVYCAPDPADERTLLRPAGAIIQRLGFSHVVPGCLRVCAVRHTFTTPGRLSGWVTGYGPAVLLLHGGPGMTDYMHSLLPELDGYRVASFQQRGVAPSTLAGPFDVPTLRDDVIDVLDTLGWESPTMIGHSWGGHLLLHLLAVTPTRVGAGLLVDPLGAVGDGGLASFQAELERRLPEAPRARLDELDAIERTRPLTQEEHLEGMEIGWPGYFSSLEAAQPIPQTGHAPSDESWASIHAELPGLAERLRGCRVPIRFVHGALDPLPVTASTETAELMDAPVDVLPGNGHFPWLEDPGCVRGSLDRLLAAAA